VDVLTGAVPDAALRGKLVLVGASAAGLGDAYPAPAVGGARLMPGVEWHATVLDNLRTRAAIVPLPRPVVTALAVFVAVAALLGQWLLAPRSGLLLALALALGVPLGATALLLWGGLWLPPAPLLLGGLLAYPLWSWRRLEAAQRFMDAELEALHAEMPAATPATTADLPHGPLEARLAILRAATAQQRAERQARKERLGFISHDLRAPLAAIVTLAERTQDLAAVQGVQDEGAAERDVPADADARLPAASQPALQLAGRYARNALDLADDLVRLGRAEAADPRRFAPVELAALADEAADAMWVQATARRVTLTTHYEGLEDATVPGDRALLRRALTNLLGNAITHSPPGSTVSVAVHADAGGFYRMDVTDQGAGIAPEQLPDLFTRYQRGDAAKDGGDESRGAGIGLGLLIVKTVAERHGGAVAVRSQPGAGSCFSMRLPAYHGPAYRGPG
jgi:signal transduction histidine kinase